MSVCCLAVVTYYFRRYIYEQPAHLRFLVIVLYALRGTRRPHLEANGLAAPGASLRVPQSVRSESDHLSLKNWRAYTRRPHTHINTRAHGARTRDQTRTRTHAGLLKMLASLSPEVVHRVARQLDRVQLYRMHHVSRYFCNMYHKYLGRCERLWRCHEHFHMRRAEYARVHDVGRPVSPGGPFLSPRSRSSDEEDGTDDD